MGMRRSLSALIIGSLAFGALIVAACGGDYSTLDTRTSVDASGDDGDTATTPDDATSPVSALPECRGQRVVSLVGGNAGLAWFTLIWPLPQVITNFASTDAYDVPDAAVLVPGTAADHPLFARSYDAGVPVFADSGTHSLVSAFVAGPNAPFTQNPGRLALGPGLDVLALAATRNSLNAPSETAVLEIGSKDYVPVAGQTSPAALANASDAIQYLATKASLDDAGTASLALDDATFEAWTGSARAATQNNVAAVADELYLAAQAFRLGLTSTVVSVAMNDRPEGAFEDLANTTNTANTLARVLDHFYALLRTYDEPTCSHDGATLSLADNVVLVVSGDTPLDSFSTAGGRWTSNVPGGASLLYVRSNGYLNGGWFGDEDASTASFFDPTTGALSANVTAAQAQTTAVLGLLYALTRGDTAFVDSASAAPYQGLVATPAP